MIGLVGFSDLRSRRWRQMMWVGRGLIILEWLVMRDVVSNSCASNILMSCVAPSNSISGCRWSETTFKPAPGNVLRIEQIANILASHADRVAVGRGAVIIDRIRIADQRSVGGFALRRICGQSM